jgi:hypothetical protein
MRRLSEDGPVNAATRILRLDTSLFLRMPRRILL